jgi:hypothetical protein
MTLVKATLQEIKRNPTVPPQTVGDPINVQVNPTSLRLALTNNTDVGKALGRPNTTFQGSSSSTLSFDLMMDTADQGDTGNPVDVQALTAQLRYFLLPKAGEPKAVPPRVLFTFGSLKVAGVMSALNLDYDLFAETGVPLRAKASVTIKEQLPQFDANLLGAGANTGSAATDPTGPAPGTGGGQGAAAPGQGGPPDRTGTALAGESAADFAARMGLDPSAWKSFAAGISDPLHLDAGLQINFSSSASASAGIGLGTSATSTDASNDPGAGAPDGVTPPADSLSPAALTAAGGVSQATAQHALTQSAAAAAATRAAFAPGPPAPVSAAPAGPPAAAATAGGPPAAAPAGTPPATARAAGTPAGGGPVPQLSPDPRATSFGFGVPLRPLIPLPGSAAVAIVHDVPRGQTWPPAGTNGSPAKPVLGPRSLARVSGCGCGCGGG